MPDRVEPRFVRAAARLLPGGSTGVVAVSGGGDSVALLHLCARAARRRRLCLHVAHLDHGMRRGSSADRRFVERLAADLGLPCHAERREVGRARRRDESPEEAARRVRRSYLDAVAGEVGAQWIALGHTLDDQAETILMRLARGGGPRALAGMAEAGPGAVVRPLLGLERVELRAWLSRHRLAWREDPTNRSARFDRNRVRRLVLPALAEATNPRAAANLVASVSRLREDAEHLDALARAALDGLAAQGPEGGLSLDVAGLAALPRALGARAAGLPVVRAGGDPRRVDRKRDASGKRGDPGGRRIIKKKK